MADKIAEVANNQVTTVSVAKTTVHPKVNELSVDDLAKELAEMKTMLQRMERRQSRARRREARESNRSRSATKGEKGQTLLLLPLPFRHIRT